MPINLTVYRSNIPEHHLEEMSVVIHCKKSEKWKADLLVDMLKSLEGFNIEPPLSE